MPQPETIFARATAPGRAGVAVIRISGPKALDALSHLGVEITPKPRYATLCKLSRGDEFIDSALILYFKAPHSFTGEEVLELHLHGGVAIVNRVIESLTTLPDFRMAKPGEFSQQAFLNEKMDLAEAEGLVEMINAETERQRKQASQMMQGHASAFFHELRGRIHRIMALLEAYIDFPEEEIPESVLSEVIADIESLKSDFRYQLREGKSAERLREGFTVLLMGKPNSGKSTLLNALVKREAAIVTDEAGTTRDMIAVPCDINGLPVTFIDTAGLRETEDKIEYLGVQRAREKAKDADLVLFLIEAGETELDFRDQETKHFTIPHLTVATKIDLAPSPVFTAECHVAIASESNAKGLDSLIEKVTTSLEKITPAADCYTLHQRHAHLLSSALASLEEIEASQPLEVTAEYLRQASAELGDIIGTTQVDDLLDIIFSTFCIGK